MTMLFRGFSDPRTAQPVTIAAGIAIRRVLADCLPDTAQLKIKWPNDIYCGDAKLAGILIETTDASDGIALIIGIGVNVNNAIDSETPGLTAPVASCAGIAQREIDIIGLAGDVTDALACAVMKFRLDPDLDTVIDKYARVSYGIGSRIRIADAVYFIAEKSAGAERLIKADVIYGVERGIDAAGRLLLDNDDGLRLRVVSGTVRRTE